MYAFRTSHVVACVVAVLCSVGCTSAQGARALAGVPLYLECAKSAISAALASCAGDQSCVDQVKAENAETCAASPDLCETQPVIAGPDQ